MKHLEDKLQEDCVRWFALQYPKYKNLLHHSPNGGKRNILEAARFKRMGTRAGYPDLTLHIPNKKYHGLFVELKIGKNKQTDNQIEQQKLLEKEGYKYIICYNIDEFMQGVVGYMEKR